MIRTPIASATITFTDAPQLSLFVQWILWRLAVGRELGGEFAVVRRSAAAEMGTALPRIRIGTRTCATSRGSAARFRRNRKEIQLKDFSVPFGIFINSAEGNERFLRDAEP